MLDECLNTVSRHKIVMLVCMGHNWQRFSKDSSHGTVKLRECSLSALLMSDRKTRSVGTLMANWNVDNKADWWLVSRLCPRTQFPPAYYLKLHHGQGEPGLLLVKRLVRRAYKHWQPAQIFFRYVDIIWNLMSVWSSHTFLSVSLSV